MTWCLFMLSDVIECAPLAEPVGEVSCMQDCESGLEAKLPANDRMWPWIGGNGPPVMPPTCNGGLSSGTSRGR